MTRENVTFLIGGLVFGVLIGFGSYHAVHSLPSLDQTTASPPTAPAPAGPRAPTQQGGPNAAGGAPMVARINELKRMLQNEPENHRVMLALGNIYYDAAMWDQASGYYERVIELQPGPDTLTDLGVCYRGLSQFDKALDAFTRANEMAPAHWQSLYNKVIVAVYDVQRFDVAQQALQSMQAIEPRPAGLDSAKLQQLKELIDTHAAEAAEPS